MQEEETTGIVPTRHPDTITGDTEDTPPEATPVEPVPEETPETPDEE